MPPVLPRILSRSRLFVTAWSILALALIAAPLVAQGSPPGDLFSTNTCESPARDDASCPKVRWGWGDCPGQPRVACDWCYGSDGRPFAYVKRTNRTYRLASGCENLTELPPDQVQWVIDDEDIAEILEDAGAQCQKAREGYICQDVSPQKPPRRPEPAPASSPESKAAKDLLRQWGRPGKRVSHGTTSYGGDTLHAVRIEGGIQVAFSKKPGKTVKQFVADALKNGIKVVGGVTGTFFSPASLLPAGPVISGGQVAADNRPSHGSHFVPRSMLVCKGSRCYIENLPVDESPAALRQRLNGMVQNGVREALGGAGRLLSDGQIQTSPEQGVADLSSPVRDARVAAGIDGRGALVLLVQQGDDRGRPARGASARNLAMIFQELGVLDAILLDGGGSTQISIPGSNVLYEPTAPARPQPTAILF